MASKEEKLIVAPHNRAGWRTTEFWLSLAASVLGMLMSAEVLGDGLPMQIAGGAAWVFGTLGYVVPRTQLKRDSLKASTVSLVSKAAELAANALTANREAEASKPAEAAKPADPPRAE
jgi:hypothetical protein